MLDNKDSTPPRRGHLCDPLWLDYKSPDEIDFRRFLKHTSSHHIQIVGAIKDESGWYLECVECLLSGSERGSEARNLHTRFLKRLLDARQLFCDAGHALF